MRRRTGGTCSTTTMSGIFSRIRSALGKDRPPEAHHLSPNYNLSHESPALASEGTIPFTVGGETHQTWYRVCGDLASESVPLLVIHGGRHDPCDLTSNTPNR